jgi:hypothetical protein
LATHSLPNQAGLFIATIMGVVAGVIAERSSTP